MKRGYIFAENQIAFITSEDISKIDRTLIKTDVYQTETRGQGKANILNWEERSP